MAELNNMHVECHGCGKVVCKLQALGVFKYKGAWRVKRGRSYGGKRGGPRSRWVCNECWRNHESGNKEIL
jgi:hypothetical protein